MQDDAMKEREAVDYWSQWDGTFLNAVQLATRYHKVDEIVAMPGGDLFFGVLYDLSDTGKKFPRAEHLKEGR